jgi:hypothetical protein
MRERIKNDFGQKLSDKDLTSSGEHVILYLSTRERTMSELREMFTNSEHYTFQQETWSNERYYLRQGDTIYRLHQFFGRSARKWLVQQSSLFRDNDWRVYIPVATLETKGDTDTFIGYIWEKANMGNHLLGNYGDSSRKSSYPNLIWCDIGNHPYPKEIRTSLQWRESQFNRYATKLIFPDCDIVKAVIFPSLLDSPTTSP